MVAQIDSNTISPFLATQNRCTIVLTLIGDVCMFRKLSAFAAFAFSLSAHALDNQFICTFGSVVKVASVNTKEPKPIVEKNKLDKYTFVIDSSNPLKASYINLSDGLKVPLHAMKNGTAYIFAESNYAGNHFVVSVFADKKLSDGYNAVMSFHNDKPTDSNDFFAQSIRVGRCI